MTANTLGVRRWEVSEGLCCMEEELLQLHRWKNYRLGNKKLTDVHREVEVQWSIIHRQWSDST